MKVASYILQVPHDVAELITYSRLSAARGGAPAAAGAAAAPLRALQQLPEEAADALIGEGCCSSLGVKLLLQSEADIEPEFLALSRSWIPVPCT